MALALFLSVLIGVSLGLLGGGGSILTTPMLMAVAHVDGKAAIATSLLVVAVASLGGLLGHARRGNVVWRVGLWFGGAGTVGAYAGGLASAFVPERVLIGVFAVTMALVGARMAFARPPVEAPEREFRAAPMVLRGLAVGAFSGFVGAGGGFLVVPALTMSGGLDLRRAIGTSLLVIALQSGAGFLGHVGHTAIDLPLAAAVSAGTLAGVLLGTALGEEIAPKHLRRAFGGFVLTVAAALWFGRVM